LTEADIRKQVTAITQRIEAITSLHSRWSGDILFSDELDGLGNPAFSAKKEWSCSITIHRAVLRLPGLFARLVHESLHAVSNGVERVAFMEHRGFEEGVVEWCTRHLTAPLATELGVEATFEEREVFDPYLTRLENLRVLTGLEKEVFYVRLLQTPLAERPETVVQWAQTAHPDEPPVRVLARMAVHLRGLR
jgi:hypothetical protein